jgi:hypothetical protein
VRSEAHPKAVSADLLATITDLYRVRRSILRGEGDMMRRIKGKERSAATYRLRAQGIEPEPGKKPDATPEDEAVVRRLYPSFFAALETLKAQRMLEEKALIAEVEKLPIMAWAEQVRGMASKSVAALVGEAGDPGNYANPAKLWKRYGLAVIDGRAQRRAAGAEEAVRQGYNAERRSAIWVVGANLIRSANPHARAIYDARKALEIERGLPKGHAHNRALRFMQKRLVLAFWLAWRQMLRGEPLSDVPLAFTNSNQGPGTPE